MTQKFIVFNITDRCNLNCSYCYANNKNCNSMKLDDMEKAIKDAYKDNTIIDIIFMGGEPLLEIDKIKALYGFIEDNGYFFNPIVGKGIAQINIVTNGTLLTDEIFGWLKDKEEYVTCRLSYDGNKEAQNKHRCNSYDLIPLQRYLTEYSKASINIVIMEDNIPTLADDIINLHKIKSDVNIHSMRAQGVTYSKDCLKEYNRQLKKLYDYYVENIEYYPCSLFTGDYFLSLKFDLKDDCVCKESNLFYRCDGTSKHCNYFLLHDIDVDTKELKDLVKMPNKCEDCILKYNCCYCYAVNHAFTGDPTIPSTSNCEFAMLEAYYNSKYILEKCKYYEDNNSDVLKEFFINAKELAYKVSCYLEDRLNEFVT